MDYRKMSLLARDSAAVRRIAEKLLTSLDGRLKESERSFLTELKTFDGSKPLRGSQQEFLFALMTRGERRTMVGGYKADYLVDQLYMAHLDFNNDEAEEFIFRKHAVGPGLALSESEWRYVFHLCRKIDIVTHWVEY